MYEQSARWNEYYRELEPEKRKALFDELCMTQPDDGANEYRLALFKARYEDSKSSGKYVDRLLFQCVNFSQIGKSASLFKRGARREVEASCRALLFEEAASWKEAGERALYWEIRNAAARYLKSCESPAYGRALFGLLGSGDANRKERAAQDAWNMSRGLCIRLKLDETGPLRIWNQAVRDQYLASDPQAGARWENYDSQKRRQTEVTG